MNDGLNSAGRATKFEIVNAAGEVISFLGVDRNEDVALAVHGRLRCRQR